MQPLLRLDESPLVGDRRVQALEALNDRELARYRSDAQPERFLTGRMLLRELAAGFTGLPLASIEIAAPCPDCTRPHGRPQVEGTDLFVSISHSGNWSLAALLEGAAVGVDLETSPASSERLAAIRDIAGGTDLRHWTRVEAVLKADGRGLRVDPRRVAVGEADATLEGTRYLLSEPELGHEQLIASVAVASG